MISVELVPSHTTPVGALDGAVGSEDNLHTNINIYNVENGNLPMNTVYKDYTNNYCRTAGQELVACSFYTFMSSKTKELYCTPIHCLPCRGNYAEIRQVCS